MRRALAATLAGLCLSWPALARAGAGASIDWSAEYRAQWAERHAGETARDQDFATRLGVEMPRLGVAGLSFSGLAWYGVDLDGTEPASPFKDTLDTYSNRDDFRLRRAALTYAAPSGWLAVTAGRQDLWGAEAVTFDGGLLRAGPPCGHFVLELFGGQRVSHYREPDPKAVAGANLELRPLEGTRIALRDLHYVQNSFEAFASQRLGALATASATYRMIDEDPRDVTATLTLTPWREATAELGYLRSFRVGDDEAFDYDYTSAEDDRVPNLWLGPEAPFADYSVALRQGFFEVVGLGVRARHHVVVEEEDEDERNVSFDEASALFDLADWPWKGLRLDAEGTRWVESRDRGDLTEQNLWGFSVRLEQRYGGHALGAAVHRQAYDADGGPRDAAGFEVWGRARLARSASLDLRYERSVDDLYLQDGFDSVQLATCRLNLTY